MKRMSSDHAVFGGLVTGGLLACSMLHTQALAADKGPTLLEKRQAAQAFGRCTARRHKEHAIMLVMGPEKFGKLTWSDKMGIRSLSDYECAGKTLTKLVDSGSVIATYKPWAFRAIVAEGLVYQWFKKSGPIDLSEIEPLSYEPVSLPEALLGRLSSQGQTTVAQELEEARTAQMLETLAECAVRKSPEKTRLLAFTQIGSAEERSTLREIGASLGGCLSKGVSFTMPTAALRGPLMVAYVRLVYSMNSYAPKALIMK